MRCICSNYGCTQIFFFYIKSNLDYTRFIKFVVVPKRGSEWQGPTPRLSAGQRSSKETSQRLRTVGYTVSDLTGLGIESKPSASIAKSFNTTL